MIAKKSLRPSRRAEATIPKPVMMAMETSPLIQPGAPSMRNKAAAAATGATKQPLTDLASAAAKLAEQMKAAPPAALDAQRAAFADMSKALITAMVADPTLQKGRFIFECPMAPAYKRWVQTHSKLQNPYWGSKMLECGEKVAWGV